MQFRKSETGALFVTSLVAVSLALGSVLDGQPSIQPYRQNPWYWEYQDQPVVLVGATDNDNLFQWTGKKLTDHLDLLVSVGGNYVRNTMSDRDEGDAYPFKEIRAGVYDLNEWNKEYHKKLIFFLDETKKRNIIVQLTLWDAFDISGSRFDRHPWNPENNNNLPKGSIENREDFYSTVEDRNKEVLEFQNRYIRRMLSTTLEYGHILYNINNESVMGAEWENYWAEFIHHCADEKSKHVHVTSMQLDPSNSVRHVLTYLELYSYIEISQNNQDSRGARGPAHWDNIIYWRGMVNSQSQEPMPLNNVKIYGANEGQNYSAGTGKEAETRFWRNIFAGCASSRFHRPDGNWGMGLNDRAKINLKAMSMLLKELDIFSCQPLNNLLVVQLPVKTSVEAYCTANIGKQYAVYFPVGRYSVDLDPWVYIDEIKLKWLNIDKGIWSDEEIVPVNWEGGTREWGSRGKIRLTTPGNSSYVAFLEIVEN